jgi:hypothetical protein
MSDPIPRIGWFVAPRVHVDRAAPPGSSAHRVRLKIERPEIAGD